MLHAICLERIFKGIIYSNYKHLSHTPYAQCEKRSWSIDNLFLIKKKIHVEPTYNGFLWPGDKSTKKTAIFVSMVQTTMDENALSCK